MLSHVIQKRASRQWTTKRYVGGGDDDEDDMVVVGWFGVLIIITIP